MTDTIRPSQTDSLTTERLLQLRDTASQKWISPWLILSMSEARALIDMALSADAAAKLIRPLQTGSLTTSRLLQLRDQFGSWRGVGGSRKYTPVTVEARDIVPLVDMALSAEAAAKQASVATAALAGLRKRAGTAESEIERTRDLLVLTRDNLRAARAEASRQDQVIVRLNIELTQVKNKLTELYRDVMGIVDMGAVAVVDDEDVREHAAALRKRMDEHAARVADTLSQATEEGEC